MKMIRKLIFDYLQNIEISYLMTKFDRISDVEYLSNVLLSDCAAFRTLERGGGVLPLPIGFLSDAYKGCSIN